jgi:transposase
MWTGMWDLESRRPVAIVPGARQSDVQRLLERHAPRESVKAVVIDLSEPYMQGGASVAVWPGYYNEA